MSVIGFWLETTLGMRGVAIGLGLQVPGAGFLAPALTGQTVSLVGFALAAAAVGLFLLSLLMWFGTGNVLAPPIAWLGTAWAAGLYAGGGPGTADLFAAGLFACVGPIGLVCSQFTRRRPATAARSAACAPAASPAGLDLTTLQLQRLLLDRALQPVERFDGFEWRDQFQTAAVRYQLNFISYALAVSQAQHTPAFSGYLVEAQKRLLAKQSDVRVWRYWKLESAWGRLRLTRDPVPHDNIMYTGFIATQIALAEAAAGQSIAGTAGHLDFATPNGFHRSYRAPELAALLTDQYEHSPWGLLACEPGWVYPLCNLITACGLRAMDANAGSDHWARIRDTFGAGLDHEFTLPDGRLVPFRSSLTGLAMPGVGGIVMQAFPCLFLPSLFEERAERQWSRVQSAMAARPGPGPFWPIDVGNYRLSRASSLAASAAAAVEMDDGSSAATMLAMLDDRCPSTLVDGVRHRPRASLWAHALEVLARSNQAGGFGSLVDGSHRHVAGPQLVDAAYPDVMVASARACDGALALVLYPGGAPGPQPITVSGLNPGRHYRLQGAINGFCKSDSQGSASLTVLLQGASNLLISPVI